MKRLCRGDCGLGRANASVLWFRAAVFQAIRSFFNSRDYLEVDTPILSPTPIPEPHLMVWQAGDMALQSSPEQCMKRLLARGYPRIYQICKCFRREERGARHLPEFTMLEWYRVGCGYLELMEECEALFGFLVQSLAKHPGWSLPCDIDLSPPWQRLRLGDAFAFYAGVELAEALADGSFEGLLVEKIEPQLGKGKPVFLYDYPVELGALARVKPDAPGVAERFELYVNGVELANAFSELLDPDEQRRRFIADQQQLRVKGERCWPLPEKLLGELTEIPPTAGIAMGLDRLVMLFSGAESIGQVQSFSPEDL